MLSNFNEFHAHLTEFLETGDDSLIVFGLYQGVSKSNKSFTVPFCHVYKLQDNKILQFRQFTDTAKILEAIRF
ncbi:nuclear transport factor 2 family protein [Candidatus Nitrosocosmicus arcticus]|uniref:Ketosteroid isomerase-related protein-like protein n=1 Tax=Candidatus Nitrosocosmicus arcticus TaxID=2035267 RepID=A0A557SWN2_9ARCH|nr:hypothetical protein [Candidatus Nitrosocosmicus arcticus]TVP41012.1 Ketosteroid isomerase-related protein-like protein [Candidatus Nitrosocosmicus arcticus]